MSYLRSKLPLSPQYVEELFTPDLRGLIAFCESKPADEVYCFTDCGNCLLGQFFQACGMKRVNVGGFTYGADSERTRIIPEDLRLVARELPYTFGAAIERARAML